MQKDQTLGVYFFPPERNACTVADISEHQGVPEAMRGLFTAERHDARGCAQPPHSSHRIPVCPCTHEIPEARQNFLLLTQLRKAALCKTLRPPTSFSPLRLEASGDPVLVEGVMKNYTYAMKSVI